MSDWLRRWPLVNYFWSHHLGMNPANVLGLKLPQCIAALKNSKLPFKIGERTEFHIKLTTNRERSIRKTRYSRRPILGFRATRRVDRGLLVSLVFLWALGTPVSRLQRSRQNFQPPNRWRNSLGFRLHHRRYTVTGRWTWDLAITRSICGVGESGEDWRVKAVFWLKGVF